jgi:hypothetical protein
MSPEEKSIQYSDLNVNERLLEIQAEIVAVEKRRIYENENLTEEQKNEMKERIKFLVSEEKMILETRYAKQKGINGDEETGDEYISKSESGEIKDILKEEIRQDEKIEGELKEIIEATKSRMWYEKWWGKLIIIFIGALILGVLRVDNAFLNNFIN